MEADGRDEAATPEVDVERSGVAPSRRMGDSPTPDAIEPQRVLAAVKRKLFGAHETS